MEDSQSALNNRVTVSSELEVFFLGSMSMIAGISLDEETESASGAVAAVGGSCVATAGWMWMWRSEVKGVVT